MSFSGGVYTLPGPALATGEVVSATENNQFRNDVAGAFNLTFLRNGTSTATANLPMGGYKLTGLGVATTSGDALSYGQDAVISDFTASGTVTISSGTANGVAYLNGSKVLTTGSALQFQNGNLLVGTSSDVGWRLNVEQAGANALRYLNTSGLGATILLADQGSSATISQNNGAVITAIGGSEQMRLTSTGLGIGTSSPSNKLEVAGNALIASTNKLSFYNTNYFIRASTGLELQSQDLIRFLTGGAQERMRIDSSGKLLVGASSSDLSGAAQAMVIGTGGFAVQAGGSTGTYALIVPGGANGNVDIKFDARSGAYPAATFWTSNTERMRIDSSGNVGIGTSSPSSFGGYTTVSVNNATNGGIYNILVNGTEAARLQAYSGIFNVAAKGASTNLTFETNSSERMRIDSNGNLLVGTTAFPGGGNVGIGLCKPSTSQTAASRWAVDTTSAAYQMTFVNNNGFVGSIQTSGSSTSYVTSSDYRLKENIQPMQNALGVVAQLNPVTYNWKADGSDGQGFIAHELQAVVPDCVTGEKDAIDDEGKPVYQGIDTSFLVATLCKAIQELEARVKQLEGN